MSADATHQIRALDEVCRNAIALARTLTDEDAARDTDCPGWTVKDHLAHMVGLEQALSGAGEPDIEFPPLDHVSNEIDAYMERHVHARRALSLTCIADEFEGMLPRRIAQLEELAAQGDPEMPAPMGTMRPLSLGLPMRVFDLWTHEQDMRRAVGQPMRLDGVSGSIVTERILALWSMVLPNNADAPAGSLTVKVTAPDEAEATIAVGGGGDRDATIVGDLGVAARLLCGRGAADEILAAATVEGDASYLDELAPLLVLTP